MGDTLHWGIYDRMDEDGSYEVLKKPVVATIGQPGVVLTGAGEVLVHRDCTYRPAGCTVAIIIGREQAALSRPQIERMLRAWDMAVSITEGDKDAVTLLPVAHHWRFSRTDYLSLDEWQELRPTTDRSATSIQPTSSQTAERD